MGDQYQYQGQNVQTVVIQQQPMSIYPQNVRDWDSGMCACGEDCGICCCVLWCPCVEMCTISQALDEKYQCCLCWNWYECLPLVRTKTRVMTGISGHVCCDSCASCCCPQLVMCQVSRQLRAMGLRH